MKGRILNLLLLFFFAASFFSALKLSAQVSQQNMEELCEALEYLPLKEAMLNK